MKNIIFIIILSCFIFACNNGKNESSLRTQQPDYLFKKMDDGLLMYSTSSQSFKLIEFLPTNLQGNIDLSIIDSTSNFSVNDMFTIFTPGTDYTFSISSSAGLIEVGGISHFSGLDNSDWIENGMWSNTITRATNIVDILGIGIDGGTAMQCKCFKTGTDHKPCDSGGPGSTSCSVEDGGTTGPISWSNKCSTDCNAEAGWYACCIEEGKF